MSPSPCFVFPLWKICVLVFFFWVFFCLAFPADLFKSLFATAVCQTRLTLSHTCFIIRDGKKLKKVVMQDSTLCNQSIWLAVVGDESLH